MKKYKFKRNFKRVLTLLLAVLTLGAVVSLITSLVVRDENEIHPTFEVGGLDENGKYVNCEDKLFSPDAIECNELSIKLDFNNNVKYQLYIYDANDKLIEKTDVIEKGYSYISEEYAVRIRILLIPEWNEDVKEEDRKVTFFNKNDFINDLTICAFKEENAEVIEMITFNLQIGDIVDTYLAIKNMTFEDFPNTSNGSDIYKIDDNGYFTCLTEKYYYGYYDENNNFVLLKKDDLIIDGQTYLGKEVNEIEITFQININGERTYKKGFIGMTWEEWVNSTFNEDNYIVENDKIVHNTYHQIVDNNGNDVKPTDLIFSNQDYTSHS